MPRVLKSTGLAADLLICIGVDDDNTTIRDFTGNSTFDVDTGVSVGVGSWKGTTLPYFATAANGSFNFHGLRFTGTPPLLNAAFGQPGVGVIIVAHEFGAALNQATLINTATSSYRLFRSANGPLFNRWSSSGTLGSPANTAIANGVKLLVANNLSYSGTDSIEFFHGLESEDPGPATLAADGSSDNGGFGAEGAIASIGGWAGQGYSQVSPYLVLIANRPFTQAEIQSVYDDPVGILFEASGAGNTAPVAADDTASTTEGVAVTIDAVANDTDANGDPLNVTQVNATAISQGSPVAVTNGSVDMDGLGRLVYTPDSGFVGDEAFAYTVSDGTDTGTGSITVTVTADAPTVSNVAATVTDDSVTITADLVSSITPTAEVSLDGVVDYGPSAMTISGSVPNFTAELTIAPVANDVYALSVQGANADETASPVTGSNVTVNYTPIPGRSQDQPVIRAFKAGESDITLTVTVGITQ